MRKNKRKKDPTPPDILPEVSTEAWELSKATAYLRASCENLYNLYMLAKKRGDGEKEAYYYARFINVDQELWSLVNL